MAEKTLAEEYKLEEMKLLRGEVELRGQERRSMERNVLLADAAIYSFVLAPGKIDYTAMHRLASFVWYLPPMLAFLALIRWRESLKMIGHLAEYIRAIEIDVLGNKGGWEQSLLIERKRRKVAMVSPWYMVFWAILIGGTLGLAWYAAPLYPAHRTNRGLWLGLTASALATLIISWPWLESRYSDRV